MVRAPAYHQGVAILIDPPGPEAHGRRWSHLVSDTSLAELHTFARTIGIPERGFEGDHYDVPEERYRAVISAGATPTPPRERLSANILGPAALGFRHRDDVREVTRIFELLGIEVNVVAPLGASPADTSCRAAAGSARKCASSRRWARSSTAFSRSSGCRAVASRNSHASRSADVWPPSRSTRVETCAGPGREAER